MVTPSVSVFRGRVTAAAIASICYDLPHPVVDGNVYRVLSRFFGIELPVNSTQGMRYFAELAAEIIDTDHPGEYNQGLMEFDQRAKCQLQSWMRPATESEQCSAFHC